MPQPEIIFAPPIVQYDVNDELNKTLQILLQESGSECFSPKINEDVIRVVHCLMYIKSNLSFIGFFVAHREALCHQDSKVTSHYRYNDGRLIELSEQDKANGVIRDFFGTSMHFNTYSNPSEASETLKYHIREFEEHILYMQQQGHLDLFIRCIEYDKFKGCIEARISRAMQMANSIKDNDGQLSLNQLLFSFTLTGTYKNSAKSDKEKREAAHAFISPFYGKEIFIESEIREVLQCDDSADGRVMLMPSHIDQYLKTVLAMEWEVDIETPAVSQRDLEVYESYAGLAAYIALGRTGKMVQFHFDLRSEKVADTFVLFLKKIDALQKIGIDKARLSLESAYGVDSYVVRLSIPQYQLLTDMSQVTALKTLSELKNEEKQLSAVSFPEQNPSAKLKAFLAETDVVDKVVDVRYPVESALVRFAARHQPAEVFIALLNKLCNKVMEKLSKNYESNYLLCLTIRYQTAGGLIALLNRLSDSVLSKTANAVNNEGCTILHQAAKFQTAEGFVALLNRLSDSVLSKTANAVNNEGCTILHKAAKFQAAEGFIALLNRLSDETINELATQVASKGWTYIHTTARFQTTEGFVALLNRLNDSALSKAANIVTNEGWTILHEAAAYQTAEDFMILLNRLSDDVINQAIPRETTHRTTVLHIIADLQSADVFIACLNRLRPDVIEQVTRIIANKFYCIPHIVATRHLDFAFNQLIQKMDGESVSAMLSVVATTRQTLLDISIKESSLSSIMLLLEKSNAESIVHALKCSRINILYSLGRIFELLHTVNLSPSLALTDKVVQVFSFFPSYLSNLAVRWFFHRGLEISEHQGLRNLLLKDFSSNHLAVWTLQAYLNGQVYSDVLSQKIIDTLGKGRGRVYINNSTKKGTAPFPSEVTLSDGREMAIQPSDSEQMIGLCKVIWFVGLASWIEYRKLIQCNNHHLLMQTLYLLAKLNAVLTGLHVPFPDQMLKSSISILEKAQSNELLIKLVNSKHSGKFVNGLVDYNLRSPLRQCKPPSSNNDRPVSKCYKFCHSTEQVEPYIPGGQQDKKHSTKKTPMTWISSTLRTTLFGQHWKNEMVGFGILGSKVEIKAMLVKDIGTYFRQWRGDKNSVLQYAAKVGEQQHADGTVKRINFLNKEQFLVAISELNWNVNEVLAKLVRESLCCIIIGIDNQFSRDLAGSYQSLVASKLGINLPILFYNPYIGHLVPYDEVLYSRSNEVMLRDHSVSQGDGGIFSSFPSCRYEKESSPSCSIQ